MKKDKKTEVDPENLDPKNQKKKINLSTMAPALSALLVVACAAHPWQLTHQKYMRYRNHPQRQRALIQLRRILQKKRLWKVRYLICRMAFMKEPEPVLQERLQLR